MRETQLSEEELLAAHTLHHGWKARWLPLIVLAIIAAYLLGEALRMPDLAGWLNSAVFMGVFSLLFLVVFPLWQRRQLRRTYAEYRAVREPVTMTFDDECVRLSTESGTTRLRWEDVLRYKEDEKVFLPYEARRFMRVVLKRAFESDGELEAFSSRLKRARK